MLVGSRREALWGAIFIGPSFLGFILFVLGPVLFSLAISFTDWNFIGGLGSIRFSGFKNYLHLLSDEWFVDALRNNLIFSFTTVPVTIILALILAALMHKTVYLKSLLQTLMFIPYISSVVAVCIVWMVLLQPRFGPVNQFLRHLGISNPPNWLADTDWALSSIIMITIWQQLGYYLIVYLAGLTTISPELYESAQVDGAGPVRRFFYITVPMISPTTFFLTTMGIIGSFRVFDQISVLTEGGPGTATTVLAFTIYRYAFRFFRMGYASAISWVLFALVFSVTLVQWRIQKKWVTYE